MIRDSTSSSSHFHSFNLSTISSKISEKIKQLYFLNMENTQQQQQRFYEDFQPSFNWVRQEELDTLVIHLPGFKKEQLRVQINSHGNLKISGERHLDGSRWSRFCKEFRIPKNCNANEIHAKFIGGLLYVKLPKRMTQFAIQDSPTLPHEAPTQNVVSENKSDQNQATNGSTSTQSGKDNATGSGGKVESGMPVAGGGIMLRMKKRRVLVIGAAVVVTVAVILGVYAACRLASSAEGEDLGN